MKLLGNLFESKALVRRASNNAIPRATGAAISTFGGGAPLGSPGQWDIDQAIQYAVDQVMWVFRCVDVISQNQAGLPIRLRDGLDKSTGEWIDDPRMFRLLNVRANSYETATQFRYRLSSNLLLSRRGAFIEIVRDGMDRPRELHILPSNRVQPIADESTFVRAYRVQRSDYAYDDMDPRNVIWVKLKPHPTDPYQQMTPLTSLGLTIMTDWLAQHFNQTYLSNGGRQGLLIVLKGEADQEDVEELKRRFSGGPMRAGEATVIEGDGIDVRDMSGKPTDVQWGQLMDLTKNLVLMGFGVPESVMGNASGRTFDNADAERENFYMDTMVPHCDAIANAFDALTGDINDDVVLAYDYTGVDVLQRAARRDRAEAMSEVAAGLRTVDSYLKLTGQEPWNVTGTSVLYNNIAGSVVAPDDDIKEKVKEDIIMLAQPDPGAGGEGMSDPENPFATGQGTEFEEEDDEDEEEAPDDGEEPTDEAEEPEMVTAGIRSDDILKKALSMRGGARPKGEALVHPYLSDALMDEKTLEGILIGWDTQQAEIIADRLNHAKLRQGTRYWDYKSGEEPTEYKALDATYAVDPTRWLNDLKRSSQRSLEATVLREARRLSRQLTGTSRRALEAVVPDDAQRAAILNRAYDNAWKIIEDGSNAQLQRVTQKITKMAEEGATLKDIEAEVRKSVGARSAWRKRITQAAVQTASESARHGVALASDKPLRKVWHAQHDERVRSSHLRADGQVRKLNARFRVGPAWLMFPRDPTGPLGETMNCRCFTTYTV